MSCVKQIIYILFLFYSLAVYSQSELKFTRYTTKQGLVNNDVLCICQDKMGFMWFGTKDGCCRFDGMEFKSFQYKSNKSGTIGQGWVNEITCTPDNQLWFAIAGPGNTFMKFDYVTEQFIDYTHLIKEQSPLSQKFHPVWSVFADKEGYIWISGFKYFDTQTKKIVSLIKDVDIAFFFESENNKIWAPSSNGFLYCYDKTKKIISTINLKSEPGKTIIYYSIFQDSDDVFWLGTDNGIIKIILEGVENPIIKQFRHNPDDPNSLSNGLVYDIIEDKNKNLLISTVNGLNLFNKKNNTFYKYFHSEYNIESINSNLIRSLYRDNKDNIWLATDYGVAKIQTKNFSTYEHSGHKNSISHNKVEYIFEAREDEVWIATPKGIDIFHPQSNSFDILTTINQKNGIHGPALVFEHNLKFGILIGTWRGGLSYFNLNNRTFYHPVKESVFPKNSKVFSIFTDSKMRIWFGSANGGVDVFDEKNNLHKHFAHEFNNDSSLSPNRSTVILEDALKNIWIATASGLNKLVDFNRGVFARYFPGNTIYCLTESHDKQLWIGSENGLTRLNIQTNNYHTFGEDDGIFGYVYGLQEDESHNLWVSTSKGLARCSVLNDSTLNVIIFREEEGIDIGNFLPRSCAQLSDGSMLFGGTKGFCRFFPAEIQIDSAVPDIVITDLKVGNRSILVGEDINGQVVLEKSISYTDKIILNHKNNAFSITFAGLQFNIPTANQYCYKLDGYNSQDTTWKYTGANDREVEYMNLPGGDYTFKVKAANSYGIWNKEPVALNIIILPPWWKTIWFRSLTIILIVALIIIIIRSRIIILNRQKQKLQFQVNKQTMELKVMNQMLSERKEELEAQMYELAEMNSELKSKTELVSEMANKIHEADQSKLRFFANISHEFRTPLALILGPLEKCLKIEQSAEWNKTNISTYLQLMQRNAKRLLRLVNQVIAFRKLDQERGKINLSNNNIIEFIEEIVKVFSPMAEAKDIQIRVTSEELRVKNEEQNSSLITHHS